MEAKLQTKIIKFLKENNAYVVKTKPGPGTPVGAPDVLALFNTEWLAIEVKASRNAPYRVGQEATLKHLKDQNPFVYTAYPENWEQIKKELSNSFF